MMFICLQSSICVLSFIFPLSTSLAMKDILAAGTDTSVLSLFRFLHHLSSFLNVSLSFLSLLSLFSLSSLSFLSLPLSFVPHLPPAPASVSALFVAAGRVLSLIRLCLLLLLSTAFGDRQSTQVGAVKTKALVRLIARQLSFVRFYLPFSMDALLFNQ